MEHIGLVTGYLKQQGRYPCPEPAEDGIKLSIDGQGRVLLSGSPLELIDLADLLVSLALSGERQGQHWHIDNLTLIADDSALQELILLRK